MSGDARREDDEAVEAMPKETGSDESPEPAEEPEKLASEPEKPAEPETLASESKEQAEDPETLASESKEQAEEPEKLASESEKPAVDEEPDARPTTAPDLGMKAPEGVRAGMVAARRPAKKRSALRDTLASAQRMMALGLLIVIGSAMVNWAVAIRILLPLARRGEAFLGDGVIDRLIGALLAQLGVLIVLPVLAWCVAWVLQERPFKLAIGAAIFAELWYVVITVMSGGVRSLAADPLFMAARYFYLLLAGVLGGLAYIHARRMADRKFPPGGG